MNLNQFSAVAAQRRYALASLLLLGNLLAAAAPLAAPPAIDLERNEIAIVMDFEPQWLDTTKATDAVSFRVLDHISEGLTTYDVNNRLVGGVAERWLLEADKATFWLRKSARWSDGKPVTAQDFVFAWRQVANPANASQYAFLMRTLVNGEAIIRGDMPAESLGVEAVDDYTLVAHLRQPVAYFLELVSFISFRPVREDFYKQQGQLYAAEAKNLLSNGPFILTRWVHGAAMRMEKNPHYWNTEAISLSAINIPYFTSDSAARFNLYLDGKIAMGTNLDSSATKMALQNRQNLSSFSDGSVFYFEFNHRDNRATDNLNLRKAMQYVFDSEELTYKVIGLAGNLPGRSLFPVWLRGSNGLSFREEFPPPKPELNIDKALAHLTAAKQELGVSEIPPLSLLLDDSPKTIKLGEYFQDVLSSKLGLDIRLDRQIFKQRLAKMTSGEFDVIIAGWGPDYNDAMTFADLFVSWNLNNRGRYQSEQYDSLVRAAMGSNDRVQRNQYFAELQQLIRDDAVILPMYERGYIYVQSSQLEGVRRARVGGDPNFNYARITGR